MPITIKSAGMKYKSPITDEYVGVNAVSDTTKEIVAPDYAELTFPVSEGQHCIHEGGYYVANQAINTKEVWTSSHWTQLTIGDELNSMPKDVRVNGTSIVEDGVADIPWAASDKHGLMRTATIGEIKSNASVSRAIATSNYDKATFYGLSLAAGDNTQTSSSNAVGVYTEDAKRKITDMIEPQFRLIKEITTANNQLFVTVTSDSNNNPFALKEVLVWIEMKVASGSSDGYLLINKTDGDLANTDPLLTIMNLFSTSTEGKYMANGEIKGGRFFGLANSSSFSSWYTRQTMTSDRNARGYIECSSITSFRIGSMNGHTFGDGSKITIYGR